MESLAQEANLKREGLNKRRLIISVFLSVAIWWWLFGSILYSLVIIFAIIVHEHGHYWQMGKEGITKRDMMLIPPFGAVAIAKEGWSTLGAEGRIGIAGPAFGIIPGLVFAALFALTEHPMWAFSVFLVGFINLFNMTPLLPLDGGRILRSIASSIHPGLEKFCVFATPLVICFAIIFQPSLVVIGLLVGFFWLGDYFTYQKGNTLPRMSYGEVGKLLAVVMLVVLAHIALLGYGAYSLAALDVDVGSLMLVDAGTLFPW